MHTFSWPHVIADVENRFRKWNFMVSSFDECFKDIEPIENIQIMLRYLEALGDQH